MRTARNVLLVALVLAMASPLMAAGEGKRKEGKRTGPPKHDPFQFVLRGLLEEIELTSEQKADLEELRKTFGPKLEEARKKVDGILTDEQKKTRAEAEKTAKAAGKKGKDLRDAVEAAVSLTDEQKAEMAAARKAAGEVQKEVREKVLGVLTPEQRKAVEEKMKKARGEGGRKKRGEK